MSARAWPARSSRALVALAVLAGVVSLASCAAFVSKSDYADYRAVRLETRDDVRLRAMQRYVARHPDGRWYDQVQTERERRDREVFEAGRSQRQGLELYLDAFPDGAFAGQARSRLAAIAVIEQRKRDEAQRAQQLADERRQRSEELSRTWVTRFFGYWIETLVGLQGWGLPIADVARGNAGFSRAFGRPPRPRCTTEECVKYYESAYAVPVPGGTRVERAMRLVLRLHMDGGGRLTAAELLLPGAGFSRWHELEERRVVVDGDPEARAQAVTWALGRIVPLIDKLAPGHQAIEGYALAEMPRLTFGPTGELTDTTAEDPGAPANRIQGSAGEPAATPAVEDLVKPTAPEPAADLEMEALQVGKDGRALRAPAATDPKAGPAAPAAGVPAASGELVLEPLAVPRAGGTAPATAQPDPAQPAAAAPSAASTAPTVRAFRAADLRIIVFAGGSGDSTALDGVRVERIAPAKGAAAKKGAAGTRPAAAPKPAVP